MYLESYGGKVVKPDNGTASPSESAPSVALAFFRSGKKLAEAGPFPGKPVKSANQKASYFVQVPLEKFPPGRYTLQLNVLDPAHDRVAFAHVPLAIVKPPPRPAPAGVGK